MYNVYDATDLKEEGDELVKRISEDVNAHENFVIGSIPDVLKLTRKQYEQIAGNDAFQEAMIIEELEGKIRPSVDKQLFYTQEKTNVFGKNSGGYILEVEIV